VDSKITAYFNYKIGLLWTFDHTLEHYRSGGFGHSLCGSQKATILAPQGVNPMKKFLIAGIAATAFCGVPALAADMAVKAPPPVAVAAPVYGWTGCYIGANTGGAWARKNNTYTGFTNPAGVFIPEDESLGSASPSGWAYGGQAGCDYQLNNYWVFGIRGMWDGSNMKGSNQWPTGPTNTNNYTIDSFGTVVGKVGYLLNPTLELYGLAGGAWAQDKLITTSTVVGESATGAQTRSGYDVGVGLSWMFARNWDVWIEYDHMGFGTKTMNLTGVGGASGFTFFENIQQNVDKVLVGIDYRFYWGAAPVPVVTKG